MFASPQPKHRMLMPTPKASLDITPVSPDITPLTPFSSLVEDKDILPCDMEEYPLPSRSVTPCGTANSSPFTSAFSTPEKKK